MDRESLQILDEEINRLPYKYRAPIVLCYLESQTHEEAARKLRWPLGTVKGRLARARSLLETRLTRRGFAGGACLAFLTVGSTADASVPAELLAATSRAACQLHAGGLTTGIVSTSIARLVQGVLATMILHKLKLVAIGIAASGLILTGAGVLARQQGTRAKLDTIGPDGRKLGVDSRQASQPAQAPPPTTGRNPSPSRPRDEEAIYRDLIGAAREAYLATESEQKKGKSPLERVYHASRLLMESERQVAANPADKLRVVENHLERMQKLARDQRASGEVEGADSAEARAYLAEAEILLAQAKAPRPSPNSPKGEVSGPGKDPKSQAILAKLEEPVAMSFPNETPLEDLLKYIKQVTQGSNGPGIPIYVDPLGLQEADKTMTSPIQLDLEGVPLRRTLQLALKQLGLVYFVDDGILVITSEESEDLRLRPSSIEPSPLRSKAR